VRSQEASSDSFTGLVAKTWTGDLRLVEAKGFETIQALQIYEPVVGDLRAIE
jgi:hypothetical protein